MSHTSFGLGGRRLNLTNWGATEKIVVRTCHNARVSGGEVTASEEVISGRAG